MPVPGILSLHVREISRARTRESQKVQEKMTTELPPVLDENTLCHVEAHARSTHSSPSCRDLIKMKRSCPSWLVDRPQTAVLFDAGHGLCCQTLSNQLSCFSGKFFFSFFGIVFFTASLRWQDCAGLLGKSLTPQSGHGTDRGFSLEFNVIASIYHFNSLMKVRCN